MLSSKDIALVASISAVYAGYSYISATTIGNFTHGVDTFFIRSVLFVVLVSSTVKSGAASLMGLVSGTVIELTTPSPLHFYIFPSVTAYGVVFDFFMWKRGLLQHPRTASVLVASALSSVAMAVVALSVFTISAYFSPEILPLIWVGGVLRDVVVGVIGAYAGVKIFHRVFHLKERL